MKVAFDEHIPPAMARAFERFAQEKQFKKVLGKIIIKKAADYAPKETDDDYLKGSDVPWVRRFAKDGGRFIISGDTNMLAEPHERLALIEEGMVVFFFGSQWCNWQFFRKCALLIFWWPAVVQKMKRGRKARFWRIPSSWSEEAELQPIPTDDRKLIKIKRQIAAQPTVAKARRSRDLGQSDASQTAFQFREREP